MSSKAERRAARERVSAYHEAALGELLTHVAAVLDRWRSGEIDAAEADEAMQHYHRAARKLWTFCFSGGGGTHAEIVASMLERMDTNGQSIDWWQRQHR